jgi:hypothetical protein
MKEYLKICRETAIKNLAASGKTGQGLNAATCLHLLDEIDKLQSIIDTHDLCHDLHGKVGPCEFAEGCAREQRKLFGYAPDADKVRNLQNAFVCLIVMNIISLIIIGVFL